MFRRLLRFFFGSLVASIGAGVAFLLMRELIEEMEREQAQPAPAGVGPTNGHKPRPKSTGSKRVPIPIDEGESSTAITTPPPSSLLKTEQKPEDDKGRTLSTREAGEMLGLSPAEVRDLIDEGTLPAHKEGRYWAIYEADVRAYQKGDEE